MANNNQTSNRTTSGRGFASMDENQQREIARKGGQSVAPENRSFSKDHDLARQAGAKGGHASHGGRTTSDDDTMQRRNAGGSQSAKSGSSSGNFGNDSDRVREAGHKGGAQPHGNTHKW